MYSDQVSEAMQKAIDETNRRRAIQMKFNEENNIIPKTIIKAIPEIVSNNLEKKAEKEEHLSKYEKEKLINEIEKAMLEAANNLDFERATELRDILFEMRSKK